MTNSNHQEAPTLGRHRLLAEADDSDDAIDGSPAASRRLILTVTKAAEHCQKGKEYRLLARGAGYKQLDDLSSLKRLDYVDLSDNTLSSLEGLNGSRRLKTLNASNNNLNVNGLNAILQLDAIRILNVSSNPLATLESLSHASFATQLLTLICTDAKIASLQGITALSALKTLVVSHNSIDDLSPVCSMHSLLKLSASHNLLRALPSNLPSTLSELRVAHNAIATLSTDPSSQWNKSVRILDVGHNRICCLDPLSTFERLININVKGNPACEKYKDNDNEASLHWIQDLCRCVEVVDGLRIAGGRRKHRINRLRNAAGLEIERDRRFARAPHIHAVRRLMEQSEQVLDEDARAECLRVMKRAESEVVGASDKKRKASRSESDEDERNEEHSRRAKRVRPPDEDDGDAVDGESFLNQAREKAMVKSMGGAKVQTVRAKKRKAKVNKVKTVVESEEFGCGGEEQW